MEDGCPDKFIPMVCQFYDGMLARVLDSGDSSKAFPITNGVKQVVCPYPHIVQHDVHSHADGCLLQ